MLRCCFAVVVLSLISNVSIASEGDDQAKSFAKIYASLCLKNLQYLEALREKLAPLPKLPPEKAALFLTGRQGEAWPVPDKHGTFVPTLLTGENFCAVHARRANTETAARLFTALVANAPSPITAKLVQDEQRHTAASGTVHTISYEWSVPNAPRKMLFTITTAPSESAGLQVLGSAALITP
jgi:hypothetical protein